jgi:zinc transport system ATP-binding protein
VTYSFNGAPAVDDVSVSINKGEYIGLIGPNGAGKSTLIKLALKLLKPQQGSIKLFGKTINEFSDWHKIGYVPQKATSFDQNFPITVKEVVAMGRYGRVGMARHLHHHDLQAVQDAMRTVGMAHLADRRVGELSGGQQQKVFIARALASEPALMILDEPLTGVDAQSQHSFYHFLHTLHDKGMTLILISHDTGAVNAHVSRLLCMNHKLLSHGCTIDFMSGQETERPVRHRH